MFRNGVILASVVLVAAFSFFAPAPAQESSSDAQRPDARRIQIKNKDYGYFFESTRWPKEANGAAIIFVCWENRAPQLYPTETQWVQSAIKESWQKNSRIEFRGWEECEKTNQGIRIVVIDTGAHVKKFGKDLDGLPEGMVLNFTFRIWNPLCSPESEREACIKSIAVHEFGHAIGFAHEQDRSDTPGECAGKFGTGTKGADLVQLTPYDPKSVMNYCNPAYNNLGKLSALDIDSLHQKYGAPTQ